MLEPNYDLIAGRLKSLAREGGAIEAAQVKLIGLDEIREAAGPAWPRIRERVCTGSLSIISRHMGGDDVVIPAGDGFLVIFAEGRPSDTQQRCRQMRDALLAFYLGEDGLKSLRPDVENRALPAYALNDVIASSLRTGVVQTLANPGRHEEIARVRVYLPRERRTGPTLLTPIVYERGARRMAYNSEFVVGGRHHRFRNYTDLDIGIVEEAVKLVGAGETPGVIAITVHSSTMQTRRGRETYLRRLAMLEPELRQRLLITVAEIERGTPLISISDWCSALRAITPLVWLDLHYADHAIASIGGAGASAAGFHLPSYAAAQRGPRAERLREQIRFWRKALTRQGMGLVVNGFAEPSFLEDAPGLGVDFLSSDAHWPFHYCASGELTH